MVSWSFWQSSCLLFIDSFTSNLFRQPFCFLSSSCAAAILFHVIFPSIWKNFTRQLSSCLPVNLPFWFSCQLIFYRWTLKHVSNILLFPGVQYGTIRHIDGFTSLQRKPTELPRFNSLSRRQGPADQLAPGQQDKSDLQGVNISSYESATHHIDEALRLLQESADNL